MNYQGIIAPPVAADARQETSEPTVGKFDRVECRELTITHPDNVASITARVDRDYAGLWLGTGRGKQCIGFFTGPNGNAYIAFCADKGSLPRLTIGTGADHQAVMQVVLPGEGLEEIRVRYVPAELLVKLLEGEPVKPV